MNTRPLRAIGVLLAGMLALQACATQAGVLPSGLPAAAPATDAPAAVDRAGNETVTLRVSTIDDVNGNGVSFGTEAFVKAVDEVSGGHLKLEVTTGFGGGGADAENQLIKAIGSGEVDLGWPSVRAFASAGIHGFEAIEAPLTLTNDAAVKALVTSPVAGQLMEQLSGSGVQGLGLLVDTLRRPFAADAPLLGPADWKGVRFRTFNSPIQADTVTALGGTPVDLGGEWIDQLKSGTLRGAEFDIPQYHWNGFTTETPFVTANVVLWPKVYVLAVSRQRVDSLTQQQRNWLTQAAQAAVNASVDGTYDETAMAADLCKAGVRFVSASASQLAALKTGVAPVIAKLAADPVDAPILQAIQGIAAAHPEVQTPAVPPDCTHAGAPAAPTPTIPTTTATLPDGTYRQAVTLADLEKAGVGNGQGSTGIWTLKISNGTYALSCNFDRDPVRDCGNGGVDGGIYEGGYLRGSGHDVWFVGDETVQSRLNGCGPCQIIPPYGYTWSLVGETLTFADPHPAEAFGFALAPWKRIGS